MPTLALRWIFTLRRECRTSGWLKANLFGWCSTRERRWPNWTKFHHDRNRQFLAKYLKELAGTTGLEPAASAVTGQRSNQLNYDPAFVYSGLAETSINIGDSAHSIPPQCAGWFIACPVSEPH